MSQFAPKPNKPQPPTSSRSAALSVSHGICRSLRRQGGASRRDKRNGGRRSLCSSEGVTQDVTCTSAGAAQAKKWHLATRSHTGELAVTASNESRNPLLGRDGEVAYAAGSVHAHAHETVHASGFWRSSSARDREMMQWSSKAAVEMLLSALAEIAEEDGMPPGAIDVAPASHDKSAEIGQALTSSQAVQMISFQDRRASKRLVMEQSAKTVKCVSLELGGSAAFATKCVCGSRVFVHESMNEEGSQAELAVKLVKRVNQLKMGFVS
ncbi:unnamed protein product [Hyaloperonospora brassicae]|uniref:Aldehyde dehydrogenase domain-containing protein n=1 Tax=Hyaloperonospora brassicae TaxID=162125 RepID=A0AAV0U6Z7_HYABA|nr:unnamed protein product [Hyaloperonospora brassicae]